MAAKTLDRGTVDHFASLADRCHVAESNLQVVRYALSRLRKGAFRELLRRDRRKLLRALIARHAANRSLYLQVMRGF